MDHARAAQFDPAGPLTDTTARAAAIEATVINFSARLSERKIGRSKAGPGFRAEQAMNELRQSTFQMRHRNSASVAESFDLIEHRIMGRVGRVAAKDSARRNHAHGRAAPLHRVNLHRRSLRTQRESVRRVERVLRIARRMTFRDVERVEIIKVGFDLAIVFDGIAERNEDVFDALPHQSDRMQVSRTRATTRNGNVETSTCSTYGFNETL